MLMLCKNLDSLQQVISDCWKAYDCLSTEAVVHQSMNHLMNFIDSQSAAHTQNIERIWREVRGGIPHIGQSKTHMAGYLAEFLFKKISKLYRTHSCFLHCCGSAVFSWRRMHNTAV